MMRHSWPKALQAAHRTLASLGALAVCLYLLGPRVAQAPERPPIQALAPFEVIAEDVRAPRHLAVDLDGHLLVSEANPGQVLRVAPDRTAQILIDRLQDPEGLTVEPTGAVVVAADRQRGPEGQGQRGVLLRRNPLTGVLSVVANDFRSPRGLARKVDGSLLLSAQGRHGERDERGVAYAISTAGQISQIADAFKQPQAVLADDDGGILVAAEQFERGRDRLDGSLFRIDPTGQVSAFITRRLRDAFGLAEDPLGSVYLSGTSIGTPGPEQGLILKRRPEGTVVVFAQGLDVPRGLALDRAGHLYLAEAGRRRILKFTAPPAPTLDPTPPVATNQPALQLQGTSQPGALLTVLGGATPATALADSAGTFSIAVSLMSNATTTLELYATARGGDGLTSAPAPVTVIHDELLPAVAVTNPSPGALARGTIAATATAEDESGSGLALVTLKSDATTLAVSNTSPLTTTLDTTSLADGPHDISASARDRAANEATAAIAITTDNTQPVLAITAPAHGGAVPSRTPELRVIYSDATAGIALSTFRATLDGTDISSLFAVTADGAMATVPSPLAEGPHALTVTIADRAGNVASVTAAFTISTSPDFALAAAPTMGTAIQGMETSFSVTVVPFNNYANLVSLVVTGLPSGASTVLTPPQVAPNATARLAVTAPGALAPGAYPFTVIGTGLVNGTLASRSVTASLTMLPAGPTALSGRVVTTEEAPLANVTIRLGTLTTLTDGGGNFLLPDPPPGPQVVLIDGSTASTPTTSYPTIPVTVTIQPGVVTPLGFTPHLHAQPVARTVPIAPGQAAIVTDPAIPSFQVQIPAGVTIVGWDGQANTQIAMRLVPPDRSPLPPLELPAGYTAGPIYMFYFGKVGGGTPTAPVPIIGPNDLGGLPGETVDLYFYDEAPDGSRPNRWAKYGTGTISSDGTQILPDLDPATGKPYGMPRFCCGAWVPVYPPPPPSTRPPSALARILSALGLGPTAGEPVDLGSGLFILQKTDLVLPGPVPLALTRIYRTLDDSPGPFGPGTSHPYEVFVLNLSPDALLLTLPGNSRVIFSRAPDGTFVNSTEPGLRGGSISLSGSERLLRFKDGAIWTFDGVGRLIRQADRNGNKVTITRDGQGRVAALTEPAGRQFTISYSGTGLQITQVTDPLGRTVRYGYDGVGRLTTVMDPSGGVTSYTYDAAGRLATITDPRGITFLRNEYDGAGRVSRQIQADGGIWSFSYTLTSGVITETRVTDPRGLTSAYRFNTSGYLIAQTDALGQSITLEREGGTNLLLSITDPPGRVTRFAYDASGNVASITDPADHVRTFTYEPTFSRLTAITDPLGNLTQFGYDGNGSLTRITDPLGATTQIGYNAAGQPTRVTDPVGNGTNYAYDPVGNLSTITDPLGHASTRTYDGASRLVTQTDPRGTVSTFAYDALNRLTQIVDPLGSVTRFTYDGNGNLHTVTDALSHTLTHEYDAMDRLSRRIDPVGAAETYAYDGNGNLVSATDRKGQITTFTYDALNRRTRVTYADGAVATFTYDAAGRLVLADDTADPHRPITLVYDTLERLLAETTSLGTVAYQYDALGRRTQMTVNDLSAVAYTYDAASRLRTITQAPLNPVTIDYDPAGRRTRLTLPNAVSTEYQYDAASRLTALIYRNATGLLGDLIYTYDPAGNRTGVGGTFARTLLPNPVFSATYDAANRQRTFSDKTMSYDANGNLASITELIGATTFTWDAQNRLTAISSGPSTLTLAYDAFGRRAARIANGSTTAFHYSVTDVVRDVQAGGEVSYLRGLGADQTLTKGAALSHLTDATNSTLAVVDPAGVTMAAYTYEPFGKTLSPGLLADTRYKYTGREQETGDLYYYRARYYHAGLMRFIQPDPLGLLAGVNPYVYVENSPTNFLDPSGLRTYVVHGIWTSPDAYREFALQLEKADPSVTLFPWRGHLFGDTIPSTRAASSDLFNRILQDLANDPLKPGEKLNLIGHSAGGFIVNNVANMLKARGIKVNNLIFMGSPQMNGVINRMPPACVPLTNFVGLFDPLATTNTWTGGRIVSVYTGIDPLTAHTSYTKNPTVIRTIQQLIR